MSHRLTAAAMCASLACLVALSATAVAGASEVVYRCGANLCAVNPDGSGQTQLTTDGQTGGAAQYGSPSLSRDGTRLAFVYASQVFVGSPSAPSHAGAGIASTALTVSLRPDGQQLFELESALGMVQLCTYAIDGSGRNCPYGTGSAGWSADAADVLISVSSDTAPYNKHICLVPTAANAPCTTIKADDPAHDLYDPAVSPDGSTLAVTVANGALGAATTGHIALYDYASGAFLRDLTATADTSDQTPVWSPDGSQIAFVRGASIYVTPATGSPGSEHQLVASGDSPSWGGGAGDSLPTGSTGSTGAGSGSGAPSGGGGGAGAGGGPSGGGTHGQARSCLVPRVVGRRLADAKRRLLRAGCRPGRVHRRHASRRRRGRVVAQSIKPGRREPAGKHVNLTIGR